MLITFKTLNSKQKIVLEVGDNDTVLAVKKGLANLIKNENDHIEVNIDCIKLYCGNYKMKDTDFFLQVKDPKIKNIYIRLARINSISQQQNYSISEFSFFKKINHLFTHTALSTNTTIDYQKLQQGKAELFTTGAIPKDDVALKAQGATVHTNKGVIIDLSSMTLNCILGFNDPWVKLKQISYLLSQQPQYVTIRIGFPLYYSYPQRLSQLLTEAGFENHVINHRQCNGSDAIELAIHAAFEANKSNRKKLASFKGSYHGQNLTASLVSEHQPSRFLINQPQEVEFFPAPTYDEKNTQELSKATQETLNILKTRGEDFFAVLIEPLQVRNAMHECPVEFLQELKKICDGKNICLIFDEIQTGFGWLGTLCASKSHDVTPDIAVFSKAVTAGHGALAIMVANKKYQKVSSTFSGKTNAGEVLSLVAADAVLDRLFGVNVDKDLIPHWLSDELKLELEKGLLSKVPEMSDKLATFLQKIQQAFPQMIRKIKGQKLVRGLEILSPVTGEADEKLCAWLINKAYEHGVYLRQSEHVIIFKPPLSITDEEYKIALERMCSTFQAGQQYIMECQTTHQVFTVKPSHG